MVEVVRSRLLLETCRLGAREYGNERSPRAASSLQTLLSRKSLSRLVGGKRNPVNLHSTAAFLSHRGLRSVFFPVSSRSGRNRFVDSWRSEEVEAGDLAFGKNERFAGMRYVSSVSF